MAIDPVKFAQAVLPRIGAPVNQKNVAALVGWAAAEGGANHNNPFNTTQSAPGAVSMNSVGVKTYTDYNQALDATVQTLKNGSYGGIIQALKQSNPGAVASAIGHSPWGTNGSLVSQTISGALGKQYKLDAQGLPTVPSSAAVGTSTAIATTPRAPSITRQVTTQGFNETGYAQAQRSAIAGQYLSSAGKDPYAVGAPKTGLESAVTASSNPLLTSGQLTTKTPNPADYVTTHTQLEKIAGAPLAKHPAGTDVMVAKQAIQDASGAGANAATQKLLRMLHYVSGATYSQANHDAINENEFAIKAKGTDCSGLISWLMGKQGLGIWTQSLATPSIASAPGMQAGKGKQITVWNNKQAGNAGHVFIQIGSQFFASEGGGKGVGEISAAEAQNYILHGSDGGTYQALHPKGL